MSMAVPFSTVDVFHSGKPLPLFQVGARLFSAGGSDNYAVSRDGQRFLLAERVDDPEPHLRRAGDEHAAIIGAEVDGSVGMPVRASPAHAGRLAASPDYLAASRHCHPEMHATPYNLVYQTWTTQRMLHARQPAAGSICARLLSSGGLRFPSG